MPSQQISAEAEVYFKNNWTQTALEYITLLAPLDTSTLDEYISIRYFSVLNTRAGMDAVGNRIQTNGYLRVMVYQKKEILALGLGDDVKEFFSNKALPYDINVDMGQDYPVLDMGKGFLEIKGTFDISQFS